MVASQFKKFSLYVKPSMEQFRLVKRGDIPNNERKHCAARSLTTQKKIPETKVISKNYSIFGSIVGIRFLKNILRQLL